MTDNRNATIVRFCLVFSLAIALTAIGLVILLDFASRETTALGRISLSPGGGLVSLLVSASLLALLFHKHRLATLAACVTLLLVLAQISLVPEFVIGSLKAFTLELPLALVVLLTELALIAAIHLEKGRFIGLLASPVVVATGLLSIASYWAPSLHGTNLGTIPGSTIIVSPLVVVLGLSLPFLHTLHRSPLPDLSPALILVGVSAIALTIVIWNTMRVRNMLYLPPLVLFTGLTLSFLVMLSHLFWRESERRSLSLQRLNESVSAHLRREQFLRHANERIMAFSRDILCSIDDQGRFIAVNPASETILGYRPDELVGQPYDTLLPPEDRQATAEELQKLKTGERRLSKGFRNHLRHRDGHFVTISWTADWSQQDQALFCVGRDMTDQLAAELLMRERDQFFSLSPDMFCIVDLNSHFFEVNRAFEHVLGYSREELLGASYLQLIHGEDRPKIVEAVAAITNGNNVSDLDIRAISKDNTEHWLELSATLSSDDLIYVAARDITDIRITQEKLRESERLLTMAEGAARIGGWVLDLATGEMRWSHAMFEIHDMTVHEVPTVKDALALYTRDSRESVTRAVEACKENGIPFDEELQVRAQTGHMRWVRAIGQAVKTDEGRIVQIQGALQDVTASHQAMDQIRRLAERQATIFESITDAFFTVNRDWRFTYINQRSEELLGCSRQELLGNTLWDSFPAVQGSEFETQYRRAVETGESVSFESFYEPLNDWFEVSVYPSEEGLAVYYRSIKERKQAQRKLEQTMAELERSNRELQDFAFVASHDLQEPLRKIQAFSDRLLARSSSFDAQEQDYLQRMQSAAKRMQALIQDLLSYSRVTTRAKPLTVCDTNQILSEVLQDMETVVSREAARIHSKPLPPIIGDATQIRQVFQNLLSNALKFHEKNRPPEVSIQAENETDNGWTLVVSDNGVGFDQLYADKLFHPFQRLHQREFPGTGIGMAIVKKILDRHGATVDLKSGIDQGTTFRIYFPTGNHTKVKHHG
jgi:PAS domain S-box-containing protein